MIIVKVNLTNKGAPFISTSKGECYTLHPTMKIWISVLDGSGQPETSRKVSGSLNDLQSDASFMRDPSSVVKTPSEVEKLSFQAVCS